MSSVLLSFVLFGFVAFGVGVYHDFRSLYAVRDNSSTVAVAVEYLVPELSVEHFIQELDSGTVSSCLKSCIIEHRCISFIFNKEGRLCRLYSNVISISEALWLNQTWTYYNIYHENCPTSEDYISDVSTGLCVKPYLTKSTYAEATYSCRKDRATLVRIDSERKWAFIKDLLNPIPLSLFYVQGTYKQGHIVYDNGDNVTFIMWAENPDLQQDDNNFRLILSKGDGYKWRNTPESNYNGFICQKSIR